jgi:hypothetical protein
VNDGITTNESFFFSSSSSSAAAASFHLPTNVSILFFGRETIEQKTNFAVHDNCHFHCLSRSYSVH